MSVSEPFIRRPIATSLLGIALLIGGGLGYFALPVSALPQVDFPTVQVTTQLPGASPDVIASLITAPLERQLGQIPSLASLTSVSSAATSQITLQFHLERDIDAASKRALDDIRREVADLTVMATEKVTRKTLDTDDQKRLVEEALGEVDFSALSGSEN